MMNSVAWVFLPYFAFLGMIIAGLHYQDYFAIGFGIFFMYAYDVKPELEIICKRPIFYNCNFEDCKVISKEQEQK